MLAWGVQSEEAAFATEYIPNDINPPTAGTATRAGERIYTLTTSDWLHSSRLGLYVKLQPKGSSSQYTANMRLWTIDASNYCEIDKTHASSPWSLAATRSSVAGGAQLGG